VTAVPRPTTKLTDEQRRLLDQAVESAKSSRAAEQRAWEDAIAARNAGVPDEMLCDETGLSRSTLNRKYGPRREGDG
jgi:predicted phage gp36 major capsid-like protein